MLKTKQIFLLLSLFFCINALAQNKKNIRRIEAIRLTEGSIKIDGNINEAAWKQGAVLDSLVEFRPQHGRLENEDEKTICYLLYNDNGIYVGGYCHEKTSKNISKEFAGRDAFGSNDYVGITFDTYQDELNGFEYFLTPLGEQMDAKIVPNTNNSEDFTWNAVWEGASAIHEDGWSFEFFIPFSAIRFSKKDLQTWGINFTRRQKKTERQFMWNPIDVTVNGFLTQSGRWENLKSIKPILRLEFTPYFTSYINRAPEENDAGKNVTSYFTGGMDLKYGINQAMTLDATLIPDFGQVISDNRIYNLTPYETKFTENRSFFTEGTELFSIGELFYPRRIGIDPVQIYQANAYLQDNETIKENPSESKIINATKLSGRTAKGTGIGVLNAVTNNRYAVLYNSVTNTTRKVLTDPLTNYNVFVIDQTLKNNSNVSFINTNVWRKGSAYDANVSLGSINLYDKKNVWKFSALAAHSALIGYEEGKTKSGYGHRVSFGKTSGKFTFEYVQELFSKNLAINDLGYLDKNNFLKHTINFNYYINKPSKWYNHLNTNFNVDYKSHLLPFTYENANIYVSSNAQLKNLWYVGCVVGYEPEYNDYYEPHEAGRTFRGWSNFYYDVYFSTHSAKRYFISSDFVFVDRSLFNSKYYNNSFYHRFRFNKKFSVSNELSTGFQKNNTGYVTHYNDEIIFGRRDIKTIENTVNLKYSISNKMNINTRIRHYWFNVQYNSFYNLQDDGSVKLNADYNEDRNLNLNYFNVDCTFSWEYAPGSFLTLAWKNDLDFNNDKYQSDYFSNLDKVFNTPSNNEISLRVIYFIDYLKVKKLVKKKS